MAPDPPAVGPALVTLLRAEGRRVLATLVRTTGSWELADEAEVRTGATGRQHVAAGRHGHADVPSSDAEARKRLAQRLPTRPPATAELARLLRPRER